MAKMGRPRLPKEKKKVAVVCMFPKEIADDILKGKDEAGWSNTEAVRHYFQRQLVKKFYPNLVVDDTEA